MLICLVDLDPTVDRNPSSDLNDLDLSIDLNPSIDISITLFFGLS